MTLRIAPGLELPDDTITQAIGILARRGAGKTYTAAVIVEEVIAAGLPVVVLDPLGVFWGLRSSADGKKAGVPVYVFGGEHGDVVLEPTAGHLMAEVVVDHPGAYVLDLSGFESNRAQDTFVTDFTERLYRAKAKHRDALLLVVDEADSFAPQRPGPNQLRMLGAMEAIVRRGRVRGLGCLLISQRAAVLNKNCLTQIELLIAMQTTSPQDRGVIDDWVEATGTKEERALVMGTLASLERGEAWVWSPSWLGILKRIRIRKRRTFDSSATPEAGSVAIAPKARAEVDLTALGAKIAATVEQVRANDPAELRKRIRDLERALSERPTEVERVVERVEVEIVPKDAIEALAAFNSDLEALNRGFRAITRAMATTLPPKSTIQAASGPAETGGGVIRVRPPVDLPAASPTLPPTPSNGAEKPFGRSERAILNVLAQFPEGRTKTQVSILTGYSIKSSGFQNALSHLRTSGLITRGEPIVITDAGMAEAGPVEPVPQGAALLDHWRGKLGKSERAILETLATAFPGWLDKTEISERSGYSITSSGFQNSLSKLRSLQLIEGYGTMRASEDLF